MSIDTPPSDLESKVERRIARMDQVEQSADLEQTIEYYEDLADLLEQLEAREGPTDPKTRARIDHVEERLADLRELREAALEGATEEDTDPEDDGSESSTEGGADRGAFDSDEGGGDTPFEPTVPDVDLSDYVGRADLKQTVRTRVLAPYRDPEGTERFGLAPTTGLLLHGPAGTGKSYLARALGGEADLSYIEVKIPDIRDRYVGESEENVRELFEVAAEHAPSLVCMDEVDALATRRGDDNSGTGKDDMVNTFLDEFERAPSDVLVVGTTNRLDRIDDAFRRTGRFAKEIEVGTPGTSDREKLLRHYMTSPVERPRSDDLPLAGLARETAGFSAANLKKLVEEAAWDAYERDQEEISLENFRAAFGKVDPVEESDS